jgi:hypothetical protein
VRFFTEQNTKKEVLGNSREVEYFAKALGKKMHTALKRVKKRIKFI